MVTHERQRRISPAQTYLRWAIKDVSLFRKPDTWLPLLVEFAPGLTLDDFRKSNHRFKDVIRIPEPFRDESFLPRDCKFCVFFVSLDRGKWFTTVRALLGKFRRVDIGPPVIIPSQFDASGEGALESGITSQAAADADGRRVVTVVIDEGIAFAHPRFRRKCVDAAGEPAECTRIEYIWVQDASGSIGSAAPGKEFTASDIDNAVNAARTAGKAEDSVYTDLGVLDMKVEGYKPLAHRQAHGTHVLDMASGYDLDDPHDPPPETRPIIAVEMPEASVGDPAGSTLKPHAAAGLVYALWRAHGLRRVGETLPVVANLSYGPHEGPHDGSSLFEFVVDFLTAFSQTVSVPMLPVFSAGNYRQSRVHANFQQAEGREQALQWRLQPCGLAPSFMEIYFESGPEVYLTLTPPGGAPFSISTTDVPNKLKKPMPSEPVQPYTLEFVDPGSALQSFVLAVGPTASDPWAEGVYRVVPSGIWKISILVKNSVDSKAVPFDAWIKRSDTPPSRRAKGRQSYFDDDAYQRFDSNTRPTEFDPVSSSSYVRRQNTLSGIATGREPYVIGGYRRGPDRKDLMPTIYTSEASDIPVPGRAILGVNWLAPADDAMTCLGTLGAGTRGAGRVAMNGTSVAAPQAVRYYVEKWAQTGVKPGPMPPAAVLDHVSPRVLADDQLLVAGVGLMRLKPPKGHRWKDRQYSE